jgi:hypothetical protein
MSLTAEQVGKVRLDKEALGKVVHDTLATIDDRIRAHTGGLGRAVIEFDLPSTFPQLGGVPRAMAQVLVYSSIVRSLLTRGFEVRVVFAEHGKSLLYVAWETNIPKEEVDAMKELLQNVLLPAADVARFCRGDIRGRPPAGAKNAPAAVTPPAPPADTAAKAMMHDAKRAEKDLLSAVGGTGAGVGVG